MNEANRKLLLEHLTRMVDEGGETIRITMMRPVLEAEPVDGWKRFEPGKTAFVILAIGPESHVEELVKQVVMGPHGMQ